MFQYKVGHKSDIGRKRSQNQDNSGSYPELGLFVVSDGMGGHRGGEIASSTAVEVIHSSVKKGNQNKKWTADEIITKAIQSANSAIFNKSKNHSELQGMGTTTTALLFQDENLSIGHVGDSRCYLIRPEALWQLTRDHSLVQEKIRAGLISRSEAKTDRMKNVITRSVGFEPVLNVELYHIVPQPKDCFLLCSDGLTGLVEDGTLLKIVQEYLFEKEDIQSAADHLIEAANKSGGDDNITALLVQVI